MLFLQQKYEFMEYFQELKSTKIFDSASEFDCQAMMFCFKTRFKTFDKNEKIVTEGDPVTDVVMVLKGSANVLNEDDLGNISIISRVGFGEVFGLEELNNKMECFKNNLVAKEKCLVMFMNAHRLMNMCENKCKRHELIIKNLMSMLLDNNKILLEKLNILSKKSTREKLLAYFKLCAEKNDNTYFEIPFNKTELANYLSVDRSAMSTELNKLKSEGIIDFDKKQYHLIKKSE